MSALGQKRTARLAHVRFTPKSGHEEGDFLNLGVTRRNGRGVVMGTQVIGVV